MLTDVFQATKSPLTPCQAKTANAPSLHRNMNQQGRPEELSITLPAVTKKQTGWSLSQLAQGKQVPPQSRVVRNLFQNTSH